MGEGEEEIFVLFNFVSNVFIDGRLRLGDVRVGDDPGRWSEQFDEVVFKNLCIFSI